MVLDENLDRQTLGRFPVVCLPNLGILSQKELNLLRDYVRQGGGLIVTGQSGLFDRMGKPLGKSSMDDLVGAEAIGPLDSLDNWVRFSGKDSGGQPGVQRKTHPRVSPAANLAGFLRPDWPFLVHGPATVYRPTTATAIGELLKPQRAKQDNRGWPMSADAPVGPAVLVNPLGNGTVVTFACSPDAATASQWPVVEARKLFAGAVRYLHRSPRVRIEAPLNVESVVADDPTNRILRIHLIAYQAPPQTLSAKHRPFIFPALVEDLPLYRVTVESAEPFQDARSLSPSTVLKTSGRRVDALVNDVHEVLLLRY